MTYEEIKAHAEAGGWFTDSDIYRDLKKRIKFQIEVQTLSAEFYYKKQYPAQLGYLSYPIDSGLTKYNP